MSKRICKKIGTWFECSALYMNALDGEVHKMTVCVEAMSFAEAENTAFKYFKNFDPGGGNPVNFLKITYNITSISIASYKHVYFRERCTVWFKASVKSLDGYKAVVLLKAEDIMDALSTIEEKFIGTGQNKYWNITKLENANILDVVSQDLIDYEETEE